MQKVLIIMKLDRKTVIFQGCSNAIQVVGFEGRIDAGEDAFGLVKKLNIPQSTLDSQKIRDDGMIAIHGCLVALVPKQ